MASRPGIDARASQRLSDEHQQIVFAVKAEFDTDTIQIHSGGSDLVIGGSIYVGAGTLLAISDVEDTKELKSAGVTFTLSGMDTTVLGYALTENYQNRPITLFLAFISAGTDHVESYMTVYKGRMLNIVITDDVVGSQITIETENRLIDLRRPSNFRYTKESQNYLYSGDTSLDAVSRLQDKDLFWGRYGATALGATVNNGGNWLNFMRTESY